MSRASSLNTLHQPIYFLRTLPEADGTNFVTRVKLFPVESGQLPVFCRLGTPDMGKKHMIYEAGHGGVPRREAVRETLDWLDKYLGPVRR